MIARMIPKHFRRLFVDKTSNRLSLKFFFDREGLPRAPYERALREFKQTCPSKDMKFGAMMTAFWSFTPFIVGVNLKNDDDDDAFERKFDQMEDWLANNTREPWLFFIVHIEGRATDAVGFHLERDAVLFRAFGMP